MRLIQALISLGLLLIGLPCTAQPQGTSLLTDPRELEVFMDKFLAEQMEKLYIPGAVFLLVKDGEIFFAKGYGYADVKQKIPVVPEKTLFRVGSVSKLFTATAVMQLYERGKLRLDDDVNKYLTLFKLENKYARPVTIAHLLTHTAGFDQKGIGIAARRESEVIPLGEYLAKEMPPHVMPPGEVINYSNHGMALAGYLVEVISGIPFARYIEENILKPLGMNRSSFLLPPHLAPDLAVGYEYSHGRYQPVPFDYFNVAPAGSLVTTATDIARFMIAHLQQGRYGDARILHEATAQEMHRQQFTNHPRLPGVTYGFFELYQNNQRALRHNGGLRGFYSLLFLLPEHNVGFFLAVNNFQGANIEKELITRFLDRYYPAQKKRLSLQPSSDWEKRAARVAGHYRMTRYSRHEILKIGALALETRVLPGKEGTLTLQSLLGPSGSWVEVEPLLFQRVGEESLMAFREDAQGHITHMFVGPSAYERLLDHDTASFHTGLISSYAALSLSMCAFMLEPPAKDRKLDSIARQLACATGILDVAFLIGFYVHLASHTWDIAYGLPQRLRLWLKVPLLNTALKLTLPLFTVLAWKDRYWTFEKRVYYSVFTLATLGFIPYLNYWNLLDFRF